LNSGYLKVNGTNRGATQTTLPLNSGQLQQSGLLYDFTPDPDSVYAGCYLAVFGTPINPSEWQPTKAYYIYPNGSFLDEDDFSGGGNNE